VAERTRRSALKTTITCSSQVRQNGLVDLITVDLDHHKAGDDRPRRWEILTRRHHQAARWSGRSMREISPHPPAAGAVADVPQDALYPADLVPLCVRVCLWWVVVDDQQRVLEHRRLGLER